MLRLAARGRGPREGEESATNWKNGPATPEQADAFQVEMWRRFAPEDRLRIVFAMTEDGFALVAASIRSAHPEYTPEEVMATVRARIYRE